jgi:phosphatidylcholine synthase
MFEKLPLSVKKALAWSVHLFTATGAVWGFLTLLAVFEQRWRAAILWIIIAMFVDGFDGTLARWFRVKEYAHRILIKAPNLLPRGFEFAGAFSILLTSAYQFTQIDAKTDDKSFFFKGFPSYWNFLVLYIMVLRLNPWINLTVLMICNMLVFVPVKYIYPSRTTRLRRLTLILTYLYGAGVVWGLLQYPSVPQWVLWLSLIYVVYYALLSFFPKIGQVEPA